ncbi:MAG TPA: transporter substrate-binding domain-containing protein, partial [Magnetospirillaceae bacterium]|nr:transporter substrate-binding domain-containing protein [Magnetospirillaceae bacterium]
YAIGTVYRDFREDYLLQHGFVQGGNLDSAVSSGLNYPKLKSGRIDLWISDPVVMNYLVRAAGDDPNQTVRAAFEIDDPAVNTTAEMAFGLKTDDHVVNAFRKALESVKADGTFAAIVKKWAAGL